MNSQTDELLFSGSIRRNIPSSFRLGGARAPLRRSQTPNREDGKGTRLLLQASGSMNQSGLASLLRMTSTQHPRRFRVLLVLLTRT